MSTVESPPELCVVSMRVVWRNTFVVKDAPRDFLERAAPFVRGLSCYVSDAEADYDEQPEMLRVIERVSRNVAPGGHDSLLRFQLAPLRVADLRPALDRWRRGPDRLTPDHVGAAVDDATHLNAWIQITPMLVLHRAGVGMVEYHAHVEAPPGHPLTTDAAIGIVRLGINVEMLAVTGQWCALFPAERSGWGVVHLLERGADDFVAVTGLRDLSNVLYAHVTAGLEPRGGTPALQLLPLRPTNSTSVVLLATDPLAGDDIGEFIERHAAALRGIGAMDTDWRNRAAWLIERELTDNLSTDAEMGLYLLGNSELLIFNHRLAQINEYNIRRLRLEDASLAPTYVYTHYLVLLAWIYLQEAILRAYIRRLDELAATTPPNRRLMIETLHNALADLVQYQEDITPYTTRIEFMQRARAYHKLDELVERFERKQDLLLNYSSEYHDYREARAAEFLNWLAAILAGGELGNLIVNATGMEPAQNVPLYLSVTLGSIGAAMLVMALLRLRHR